MPQLRVIIDPPADGDWNMAVDEALLESASDDQITLRFYQWSPATLSLGYFQRLDERQTHAASRDCPIVRRASGGGAILHDHELTYSLVVPVSGRFSAQAGELYGLMHETLVQTLSMRNVTATLFSPSAKPGNSAPSGPVTNRFLCFERRTAGDVISGGYKIGGSAQRRHHGTVLQHGSVILRMSANAPELPGICELAGVDLEFQELAELWLRGIIQKTGLEPQFGELTSEDRMKAGQIKSNKFATQEWLNRR